MIRCFTFHRISPRHDFDVSDLSAYLLANRGAAILSSAFDAAALNLVVLVRGPGPK